MKTPESGPLRLGVFASGRGTNLQALIDEEQRLGTESPYTIAGVVVDRLRTGAEVRAAAANTPCFRALLSEGFSAPDLAGLDKAQKRLARSALALGFCESRNVEAIVLAGYLSVLAGPILSVYDRRIINLHPALLPDFGGEGMWGPRVHEAVLASGRRETGCTLHYVDAGCDTGEIIIQKRCPVLAGDTPETLARRLAPLEHQAVVEGARFLAAKIRPRRSGLERPES